MRFIPSETTRRRTSLTRAASSGGPQTSGPGSRIAPKPSRTTSRSPRRMVEGAWAKSGTFAAFIGPPLLGPGTRPKGKVFADCVRRDASPQRTCEVRKGFEPFYSGFANRSLTTWLPHRFRRYVRYLEPMRIVPPPDPRYEGRSGEG